MKVRVLALLVFWGAGLLSGCRTGIVTESDYKNTVQHVREDRYQQDLEYHAKKAGRWGDVQAMQKREEAYQAEQRGLSAAEKGIAREQGL